MACYILVIPDDLDMVWDNEVDSVGIDGVITVRNRISDTVTYSQDNKTASLKIEEDLTEGNSFTISGLRVRDFKKSSALNAIRLQLNSEGVDNDQTEPVFGVGQPQLESEGNQSFTIRNANAVLAPIRLIEDEQTAVIRSGKTVRLVLPPGENISWDESRMEQVEISLQSGSGDVGAPVVVGEVGVGVVGV